MKPGLTKNFFVLIFIIILSLVLILWISPVKYYDIVSEPHLSPSSEYFFGTDYLGRDLFIRICYAVLNTFFIIGCSLFFSLFFGVIYGAYAGYSGGRAEKNMIAFLNILESIPSFLLMIVFLVLLNNLLPRNGNILGILITLAFISWLYLSRIIINETKRIMNTDYVQYAIIKKAGFWHIFYFHLLPNFKNIIIIIIIQKIPYFIFIESFLSFVGIGISPPIPSLGKMISDGIKNFRFYPHELFIPILIIIIIIFMFNIAGEAMVRNKKEYA